MYLSSSDIINTEIPNTSISSSVVIRSISYELDVLCVLCVRNVKWNCEEMLAKSVPLQHVVPLDTPYTTCTCSM